MRLDVIHGLPSHLQLGRPMPARGRSSGGLVARNGKEEGCAWSVVWSGPNAAKMVLDDRPAYSQADPHPSVLRTVEGIEKPAEASIGQADPRVFHAEPDAIILV